MLYTIQSKSYETFPRQSVLCGGDIDKRCLTTPRLMFMKIAYC